MTECKVQNLNLRMKEAARSSFIKSAKGSPFILHSEICILNLSDEGAL
jgi:hypothetical protein